jgi:hypothetical protein
VDFYHSPFARGCTCGNFASGAGNWLTIELASQLFFNHLRNLLSKVHRRDWLGIKFPHG